jgi:trk system potassium uptake protein TrkA
MVPAVARSGEIIIPGGDFRIESGDYVYLLGEPRHLDRFFGQGTRLSLKMKNLVVFGATALTRRVLKEIGVPGPEMLSSSLHERQKNPDRSALSLLGNPIIKVIGANKEQAKITAMEFPDIEVVLSDFTDEILIDEQGISNADIALCLTSHQNDNLILSLLAKSVGAKQALAVVHNDLYMRLQGDLNIDAIVNQKSVVAGAILDIIRKAHIRRLHSFNEGAFELVELTIGSGFKRKGSTIIDLGLPRGILVAFVIHEGLTAIPTGETAIYENDQVGIVLPKEQMSRLESLFGA